MDIGPEPNQLAVTPDGKFAYVPVNNGQYEVDRPGPGQDHQAHQTGGRPHNTMCSADGKHVYLAPMGSPKKVTIVDVATHKVIGEIPFSNVVRPIALSRDEKRLFAEVDGLVGIEMADMAARKMTERVAGRAARGPKEGRQPQSRPRHPARPEGNLGVRRRAPRRPRLRHHRRPAEADRHHSHRQPGLLADVHAGRQGLLRVGPGSRRGRGRRYAKARRSWPT